DLKPADEEALGELVRLAGAGHAVSLEVEARLDKAWEVLERVIENSQKGPPLERALTTLGKVHAWRDAEDVRFLVEQALALVQRQRVPSRALAPMPTRPLLPATWQAMFRGALEGPQALLYSAAREATDKVFLPTTDSLAVGRGDRVNLKKMPRELEF